MTSTLPYGVQTSETDDLNPRTAHEPRTWRLQRVWSARGWGARISTPSNRIRTETPSGRSGASQDRRSTASVQWLTLTLEGITAADYLSWVRDPGPLTLGPDLRRVDARAEPLGDRIDIELIWDREPPAPRTAVLAAGFALIPEVVQVVEVATRRTTTGADRDRGQISG